MKGKIGIVGTGTMGCGIAQAALSAHYEVTIFSHSEFSVQAGLDRLKNNLKRAVAKGKMTEEVEKELLRNLKASWKFEDLQDAILVIEAGPEDLEVKRKILKEIDRTANASAFIATNTSSIPISTMTCSLRDPSRLIGLHFFNPVPAMKLVEVIHGKETSKETSQKAKAFAESLDKITVDVQDAPGFVANRILMVFINEAVKALEEGIAHQEGIDTIAKLGFNHPLGPLELADLIGLDICVAILEAIYAQTGEMRFRPAKQLVSLVQKGHLGKKTKKGFYTYEHS